MSYVFFHSVDHPRDLVPEIWMYHLHIARRRVEELREKYPDVEVQFSTECILLGMAMVCHGVRLGNSLSIGGFKMFNGNIIELNGDFSMLCHVLPGGVCMKVKPYRYR